MNTKPKTPDKYVDADMTRLKSQAEAEKRRNDKFDVIRLRAPKGQNDLLKAYVASLPEHTTVNQWLLNLILRELPPEYHLPEDKKDDNIQ